MPEHAHLLMSNLNRATLDRNPTVKVAFVRKRSEDGCAISCAGYVREVGDLTSLSNHFWMKRFDDFNVWNERKMSDEVH